LSGNSGLEEELRFAHVRGIGFSALLSLERYQNCLRELVESIYGRVHVEIIECRKSANSLECYTMN